jgi:alcohol dehydrogenase
MRQLTFIEPGHFEWWDVPPPRINSDIEAIIRPLAIARCDLDLYLATGLVPRPGPFAFGHEMIGEVVDAGTQAGVTLGQKVVVPFQISCGTCPACLRGWTNSCQRVPLGSAYGLKVASGTEFGGALSDLVHVPFANHMLVPLMDGIDPIQAASLSDNIADGWRCVAEPLAAMPGAPVLIVGGLAQSVGIYAAGAAVALGSSRVLYLDDNEDRRKRAQKMGATTEPLGLAEGRGPDEQFPIVVEAAGNKAALNFSVQSTAANGILTSVAIHLDAATPIPLTRAYYKGFTFRTGRVQSRPLIPEISSCIACGALHPEHVTHRVIPADQAADAMTDPGPKIIFTMN